jgi:hypothetical protein
VSDYIRHPQPPPRRDKVLADAMQTFAEEDAPQREKVGAEQEAEWRRILDALRDYMSTPLAEGTHAEKRDNINALLAPYRLGYKRKSPEAEQRWEMYAQIFLLCEGDWHAADHVTMPSGYGEMLCRFQRWLAERGGE